MNIKTIIFDFDGTLADTKESIVKTFTLVSERFGYKNVSEEEIVKYIGLPLRDTFRDILNIKDKNKIENMLTLYRKEYDDIALATVSLFPNVKTTLQKLHENNIAMTIASSRGKKSLLLLLEKLDIQKYMSLIIADEDVLNKKPAPDMALKILQEKSSAPNDALLVGDTKYDILMGRSAKCHTCAVSYGNGKKEEFIECESSYIITDFKNILDIVGIV